MRRASMILAAAVVAAACSSGANGSAGSPLGADTTGEVLPDAEFALLEDPDTTVAVSDWRGTPTVVNFWATWCGFCLEEMPALEAASQRLGGDVRFVGIDRQDIRDDAVAFVQETGVTYLNVSSPDGAYFEQVRARGMPTTLFVDADGVVRYRHTGPLDEQQTLDLVAEHLGVEG